jgi:hypothetical protein
VAGVCAAAALGGCYTYTAPGQVAPAVGRTFAFGLTDQGRAALAARIGPGTDRIEGDLVGVTDTTYRVRVARTVDIRGTVVKWGGEEVSLEREYIGTLRERRTSPLRTGLAIGVVGTGVAAVVALAALDVTGVESDKPEPDPIAEESRLFPLTFHRSR